MSTNHHYLAGGKIGNKSQRNANRGNKEKKIEKQYETKHRKDY